MDFKLIADICLRDSESLVRDWLPGGVLKGSEWSCGSLSGEKGSSLRVNLKTGKWADFASGDKGGDLVSLYAAINNCSQAESAKTLSEVFNLEKTPGAKANKTPGAEVKVVPQVITSEMLGGLNLKHKVLGDPQQVYEYHDAKGNLKCIVARYMADSKKEFRPFIYADGKWMAKGHPEPRPLYDIHKLSERVLIVEGEKAALAAKQIVGDRYSVTTWMNGTSSVDKTDWSPLYGKDILIWPDHDEPGRRAAARIAGLLLNKCESIKIVSTQSDNLPEGWDAADSGFTWDEFLNFAKPRAKLVEKLKPEVKPEKKTAPQPEPPKKLSANVAANVERLGLQVFGDKQKKPYENLSNIVKVLLSDFGDQIWFDEFHNSVFVSLDSKIQKLNTDHVAYITTILQTNYGLFKVSTRLVEEALLFASKQKIKNEVKEWMESLKWDSTSRVHNFLHHYMGADDNEYTRAVSKNMWVSMIARTYQPGCKADSMVILEGQQGSYKSTALKTIAGKWFAETNTSPSDKDFYLAIQSCLILEIAELDSFSKTESNTIKKVLSSSNDRFRAPYGKMIEEYPRRSIFVGTTNNEDYLKDETGARRFWPVFTRKILIDEIKRDREQLFSEALALYKSGEKWTEVPRDLAHTEQQRRYQEDIWTETVLEYVKHMNEVRVYDVLKNCLYVEDQRMDQKMRIRIAKILIAGGFSKNNFVVKLGGKTCRVYKREVPVEERSILHQLPLGEKKIKNYAPGMGDF